MKRISMARLALGMLLLGLLATPAIADTLWYNGDYDMVYTHSVSNQISPPLSSPTLVAQTYDDFVVPDNGWTVNILYSHNLVSNATITGAYWEIRQDMSAGNGGTLVSFGMTNSPSLEPTGRYPFDGTELTEYPEMRVAVTNLNFLLAAGTYWLSVTPIISNENGSVANTITLAPSGNGLACFYNASTNQNYADGYYILGIEGGVQYSMGIEGTAGSAVPLPSAALLLASGLLGLGAWRQFRGEGFGCSHHRNGRPCRSDPMDDASLKA